MSSRNSAYSIVMVGVVASALADLERLVSQLLDEDLQEIIARIAAFLAQPVSPTSFLEFERDLREIVREMGRKAMEFACNQCEPEEAEDAPHDVEYQTGGYRRLNQKTPNEVDTTFGRIVLGRRGYRSWDRDGGEPTIFPLEFLLGLTAGATPALAEEVSRRMAEDGATQNRVLQQLRREFGVSMSVDRLRDLLQAVALSMEEFREEHQVLRLLDLLKQAYASKGRRQPVLSVGRDGIHIPMKGGVYQQGAVATVSVYDRRGRRLGTVYLASPPESKQATLSEQLTSLIAACLEAWCNRRQMPMPRLCYVTDAGETECGYYRRLCGMGDPRCGARGPGGKKRRLKWRRIIDYYHASEKITIMAEALFGTGPEASAWARRMRRVLREAGGPSRVLHSAAAMRSIHGLRCGRERDFEGAYEYLCRRTRHMRYAEYKKLGLPIGSGVTEAACKTVFTQRLKLSGMQWKRQGAQVILTLRVSLLSGIWDDLYEAVVTRRNPVRLGTYPNQTTHRPKIAA